MERMMDHGWCSGMGWSSRCWPQKSQQTARQLREMRFRSLCDWPSDRTMEGVFGSQHQLFNKLCSRLSPNHRDSCYGMRRAMVFLVSRYVMALKFPQKNIMRWSQGAWSDEENAVRGRCHDGDIGSHIESYPQSRNISPAYGLAEKRHRPTIIWLVVWNMNYICPFHIWDVILPLTNSYFSEG